MDAQAGIPRSSILGSLLLLIHVNDIPDNLVSNAKLFTDDRIFLKTQALIVCNTGGGTENFDAFIKL